MLTDAASLAADILTVCSDASDSLFAETAARRARNGYGEPGDLPKSVDVAVYGIEYARQTCRVGGVVELTIRRMTREELARLIADVAVACPVVGEVARYLNARYAPSA